MAQLKIKPVEKQVRTRKKLYNLFKETKFSIIMRTVSPRWARQVRRMNEEALRRRIMYVAPIGQRKTRKPKAR
jgi:hypothetical protein